MSRPLPSALTWRSAATHTPNLTFVTHARGHALALITLTCVGFALRLVLIDTFPLREDEAIYGFWAQMATHDPFFLHTWPDKPPLFIWLLSGAFSVWGPSAATARLVSIFASTLTIPLVAWGAGKLWRAPGAAWIAALLITFNPFAVSFAPTAYTDAVLTLFGTGAVVMALRGRAWAAGLLLGAACMTKQQGLFFVPLVVALLIAALFQARQSRESPRCARSDNGWQQVWVSISWVASGVGIIVLPIVWWDSQRWAVAPSPWALAQATYAPLTWLPPQQWWARAGEWARLLWYLGGSGLTWLMLASALAVAVVTALRNLRVGLLLGWGATFIALHIITTVQVWDRYLLPLAPWLALVASGPLLRFMQQRQWPAWSRGLIFLLLVVGLVELIPPGVQAARGQMPLGGDHGDYAGLTEMVAWVQEQEQPAILYHQVLGWHLRFYLFDETLPVIDPARGEQPPRFDLRWFSSTAYLADNAAKSPYPPKYLIVPEWATPRDLRLHLALRGLTVEPRVRVDRFAVLEIVQLPRPLCDWCKSSLPFAKQHPILPAQPQMSRPATP